jgi:SHS2 domain-containing protein
MAAPFEILEHTADIGFRAWGATPAELFENAARAMMSIASEPSGFGGESEIAVEVSGEDWESLMVNWLSEILYLFDAGKFAPRDFEVREIAPERLRAQLRGEQPRDAARHRWELIIKAVTYHELQVAERNGRWEAEVFLDI